MADIFGISLPKFKTSMDKNFNPDKQHTLAEQASISGTGLHTGINVDMTLKPANPGYGFQFQRVDLLGTPTIKADCDLVTDTSRGTTLEQGAVKVSTVEHILAALVGMGVDNCLIEINGPEIPIIDGSSSPFLELIEKLKNVESVLSVKVEELLDYSILKEEERKIPHIFFRIKHTLPGVDVERYANFIMSEPSCCNVLEHPKAIEKVENLIKIETPEDQFENFLKAPPI
jgi:UDP-3-O-acyl-N-acetylglucosamine deacetylase